MAPNKGPRLVILPLRRGHPQEAQFRFSSGVIRGSIFCPPEELAEFLRILAPAISPLSMSIDELQAHIDGDEQSLEIICDRLRRYRAMIERRITIEGKDNLRKELQ